MSVSITINGKILNTRKGQTILEVAKANDIYIPTLCYHEAIESWGGCRLCMVEITKESWEGWSKLVTACLFPVDDGLIVFTDSERVLDARREVMDLLLARAPDSKSLREMASQYGVEATSYRVVEDSDNCILCGLCARLCASLGIYAISTVNRGHEKKIATPLNEPPEKCIGCLVCAKNCPTSCIPYEEKTGKRTIWNKEFNLVKSKDGKYLKLTEEMLEYFKDNSEVPEKYFKEADDVKRSDIANTFSDISF